MSQGGVQVWEIQGRNLFRQNPIRTIIVTTLATWRVDQKTPLMGLDGITARLPTRKITSQASQIVQNTTMIRASRRWLIRFMIYLSRYG